MNYSNFHDDELILYRNELRRKQDWARADEIRAYLDSRFVFVFDHKEGPPTIYWATPAQFRFLKEKPHHFPDWTPRQYLEYRIKKDIAAEKAAASWQATMLKKIEDEKKLLAKRPHPDPTPNWILQKQTHKQAIQL